MQNGANLILLLSVNDIAGMPAEQVAAHNSRLYHLSPYGFVC